MLEASILSAENPAAHLLARAIAWRGARVYIWKSGETATSEFSEDELTRLLERWVDGKTARLFLDPSSHAVTLAKAEGSVEVQIPKTDRDASIGFPPAWVFNDRDIPYQQILLDLMYFHTQARSLRDSLAILLPQPIRQLTSTDQVVLSWNHDWPGFGS
ncbi:MAG: hypothetical protein IIA90_04795, partial [Chloroflexi bacterium]|nr:hypothetical protein [Chloroflexota bacterium]